jgi:hypothetical protein
MNFAAIALIVLLGASPQQQNGNGNSAPTAPDSTPSTQSNESSQPSSGEMPVSLDRIRRALSQPSSIRIIESQRNGRPLYRVDIEAAKIDIYTLLGKDFVRGPVSYGGMTHQEFLNLVTPDYAKGFAGLSNGEGLTIAATSVALQWAVLKAIDKFKEAKDERAKESARREVEEAVEALKKARKAAGLPEK